MANPHPKPGPGRPKGSKASHTLVAEQARAYIIKRVKRDLKPIVDKAIEQAKTGDRAAREWLSDRAFGRPKETVELVEDVVLKIDA